MIVAVIATMLSACKVEFSPNAEWRDVPSVYCVLDPEEDTVFARIQRCYLGDDNLYSYSQIADSTNYPKGDIKVSLLAYRGKIGSHRSVTATDQLVGRWEMEYALRYGKPEGDFAGGVQPIYYCVPGRTLKADTTCVFVLVVEKVATGDTIAKASTNMVGFAPFNISGRDTVERVLDAPNAVSGRHFGFIPTSRNEIKWTSLPRGRLYQPAINFYYRKGADTLSIQVSGATLTNEYNSATLSSKSITQGKFLSAIKDALKDNRDTLYNVNNVDVLIFVCNEDLNAYISSRNTNSTSGQEYRHYSNIEGGVGVFGSRRTHICINVPCDSTGKPDYLPDQLQKLGVGFYGKFSK